MPSDRPRSSIRGPRADLPSDAQHQAALGTLDEVASERSDMPRPAVRERARLGGLTQPGAARSPRALLVAVGLHVVVVAVLVRVLSLGQGIPTWLRFGDTEPPLEERLTYVEPPREAPAAPVVPPPPQTRPASVPQLSTGPVLGTPPAAPVTAAPRDTGGSGGVRTARNGIGALDPNVQGVRPGYNDERVWNGTPGDGTGSARTARDGADNLDSIMAYVITTARDSLDSLARAQGKYGRAPGDWTKTGKNGDKWGWDQQGIRLGKVMIPNALLGLLPLNAATAANMSGNMSRMDADRRIAASRADIMRMSERSMGEAEFRRITKDMNDRRDKVRRERLRSPSASVAAPVKK